jgi:aldehyde:ferredoxin oxidoreductase
MIPRARTGKAPPSWTSPTFERIDGPEIIARQQRRYGCWHCPIACGGIMKPSENSDYQWGEHAHKPEYETQAMFGATC